VGVGEPQFVKKYEAKLEFLEGWGFETNKTSVRGVLIFPERTHF